MVANPKHLWLLSVGSIQFLTGAPLIATKDKWAIPVVICSMSWVTLLVILTVVTHVDHTRTCCYPGHIESLSLGPCDDPHSDIHREPARQECSLGSLPDYALGFMAMGFFIAHLVLYVWRSIEQAPMFIAIPHEKLKWFYMTPESFILGLPMLILRGERALTRGMRLFMAAILVDLTLFFWIFQRANRCWGCYPEGTPLSGLKYGPCYDDNPNIPNRRHIPLFSHTGATSLATAMGMLVVYSIVYISDVIKADRVFGAEARELEVMALSRGITTRGRDLRTLAEQVEMA